jgi:hypothetical protein
MSDAMPPQEEGYEEGPTIRAFITAEGYVRLVWTWPTWKEEVMADAVDIEGVKWPKPTKHTFKQMAKGMFECHRYLRKESGKHYPATYSDEEKDRWYLVAKQAYTTLAKIGGAKIRKIAKETT